MLVRQLGERGYEVIAAAGGAEALEVLQRTGQEIALVVSDVVMPEMSGPEMARQARLLNGELPFIFISGQPREALAGYGDPAAYGPLIEKPFTAHELAEAVRHALDQRAAG
jgi:two-component system cell cycle sensor histidine kinase/response regulator CckA